MPRLALAVAQYKDLFGEWPTKAHGHGAMAIVTTPNPGHPHSEFRPDVADRVRERLAFVDDDSWMEVSGPPGRCGYGNGPNTGSPGYREAFEWLYGDLMNHPEGVDEVDESIKGDCPPEFAAGHLAREFAGLLQLGDESRRKELPTITRAYLRELGIDPDLASTSLA